jgi:endo-1,4-beta-xylanase
MAIDHLCFFVDVGRYKGKVKEWDVVNEAISDSGPEVLRRSPWSVIIGPDFIAKAFEFAHEADPDAVLRYNDYGLENTEKRSKLIKLIKTLQEQKVPVSAIGSQAHCNVSTTFDSMDQSLTEMESLGLVADADNRLAEAYAGLFRAFVKHKDAIDILTFWGINDAVSWRCTIHFAFAFGSPKAQRGRGHRVLGSVSKGGSGMRQAFRERWDNR